MYCCDRSERHGRRYHGHQCVRESGRSAMSRCAATSTRHEGNTCCAGGGYHGLHRHYRSKAEVTAGLESYLADLRAEAQAVEERLRELRA